MKISELFEGRRSERELDQDLYSKGLKFGAGPGGRPFDHDEDEAWERLQKQQPGELGEDYFLFVKNRPADTGHKIAGGTSIEKLKAHALKLGSKFWRIKKTIGRPETRLVAHSPNWGSE